MEIPNADHRPWPLPDRPPVMAQTWHDLLFAHWPVPVGELRMVVPPALAIDTYEGEGWVGVVPFRMSGVRLRGLPMAPGLSALPELNLRTYVSVGGKPGVYFFSLDAGNPVAVAVARAWYHLPYYNARMSTQRDGDRISYRSRRAHPGAPPALFVGRYRPTGPAYLSRSGTLEYWLTERYCLYTTDRRGRVVRAEIHHAPWPLQSAAAEISRNTLPEAHGIRLPDTPPLLYFTQRLEVVAWSPEGMVGRPHGSSQSATADREEP